MNTKYNINVEEKPKQEKVTVLNERQKRINYFVNKKKKKKRLGIINMHCEWDQRDQDTEMLVAGCCAGSSVPPVVAAPAVSFVVTLLALSCRAFSRQST